MEITANMVARFIAENGLESVNDELIDNYDMVIPTAWCIEDLRDVDSGLTIEQEKTVLRNLRDCNDPIVQNGWEVLSDYITMEKAR